MTLKYRVKEYCQSQNIPISKFEKESGLSNGYFNRVQHRPSQDKLDNIARNNPDLNIQWLLTGNGQMLTTDPIPKSESKPKQLEFDFNKWMQIEEVKANSFKEVTEANKLMAESNKILAQHTTEVIKEIKDTLVRLEQQIAKNGVDVQQGDNVISAAASGFNSEK